ncbi:MAG: hypothetical protein ABIG61_07535 [Planctomycetota bacterium]
MRELKEKLFELVLMIAILAVSSLRLVFGWVHIWLGIVMVKLERRKLNHRAGDIVTPVDVTASKETDEIINLLSNNMNGLALRFFRMHLESSQEGIEALTINPNRRLYAVAKPNKAETLERIRAVLVRIKPEVLPKIKAWLSEVGPRLQESEDEADAEIWDKYSRGQF